MKRHARNAFTSLRRLGAPVFSHCERGESLENQWGAHFILSGESRDPDGNLYADYYQHEIRETFDDSADTNEPNAMVLGGRVLLNAFGIRESVHRILRANGLYCEWIDGGTLGVYDA